MTDRANRRPGIAAATAGVLALAVAACAEAPYTGRSQLMMIDAQQEAQLGAQEFAQIKKESKISTDPRANELVRRVGNRIAAVSGLNLPWEFVVIDEPKTVNAFALPGGKVAVYSGMLPVTGDEGGLAVVLAHEIGHVLARHGAERVSRAQVEQVGLAVVSGLLSSGDPAKQQMIGGLLGLGSQVALQLPFSRSQESEADRLGLILMAKAGYDPRAAVGFWQRMAAKAGGGGPPVFLSDHPADATRIADIQREMPEALKYYRAR